MEIKELSHLKEATIKEEQTFCALRHNSGIPKRQVLLWVQEQEYPEGCGSQKSGPAGSPEPPLSSPG